MKLLDTNLVSTFLKRDAPTKYPRLHRFVDKTIREEGLAISFVTQYECKRGIEQLVRQGQGRRKMVEFDKFLSRVEILGLDATGGRGWNLASRLWADGRAHKPALVFTDADLLVAATAAAHGRTFATADVGLAEGLQKIGFPVPIDLVASD